MKLKYSPLRIGAKAEYAFLREVRGVVHVGASYGQERELYGSLNLSVVWIEPIPEVYAELSHNISKFPTQRALNYLVAEGDGRTVPFHISSNFGRSSSILEMSEHRRMWPKVTSTKTITLKSVTLGTALQEGGIDIAQYDALVLDTQGAEYLVLKGALHLLPKFRFIKAEVPDFEAYKGCCQIGDLSEFMELNGFCEYGRIPSRHRPGLGTYFEVIYRRIGSLTPEVVE